MSSNEVGVVCRRCQHIFFIAHETTEPILNHQKCRKHGKWNNN